MTEGVETKVTEMGDSAGPPTLQDMALQRALNEPRRRDVAIDKLVEDDAVFDTIVKKRIVTLKRKVNKLHADVVFYEEKLNEAKRARDDVDDLVWNLVDYDQRWPGEGGGLAEVERDYRQPEQYLPYKLA